jgi:hypothetical protein
VLIASCRTVTILLRFCDVIYYSVLSNVRNDEDSDNDDDFDDSTGDHHKIYPSTGSVIYILLLEFHSFDCVMIGR